MDAPALGQDTDFLHRVKEFAVEELITQLRVEAFAVTVLPRRAWLDAGSLRVCARQPFAKIVIRSRRDSTGRGSVYPGTPGAYRVETGTQ